MTSQPNAFYDPMLYKEVDDVLQYRDLHSKDDSLDISKDLWFPLILSISLTFSIHIISILLIKGFC